ncbi:unnamed protein product [Ambrosiozyma monospora]|uniref:Unnamed protein product n=1 Tax=Ambrosiozyma monospora TaxID=43982 RepID=A0A9W6WHT9_AMBMO|nr:unnamed protein product [Ambrosiozyma monospora]
MSIDAKMAGLGAPPKHVELPYQIHTSNSMQTLKNKVSNHIDSKHGANYNNNGNNNAGDDVSIHTTISTSQISMGKTTTNAGGSRRLRKFKKKTTGNEDCIIM